MLHLFSFIGISLAIAFALGIVFGFFRWSRGSSRENSQARLIDVLQQRLHESLEQQELHKAEYTRNIDELVGRLTVVTAEHAAANREIVTLNGQLNDCERRKALLESGPRTLGDLAQLTEERNQLRTSLAATEQALEQAKAIIHTANAAIQTQHAEIERLKATV